MKLQFEYFFQTHSENTFASAIYESSQRLALEVLAETAYPGGLSIKSNPLFEKSGRNETLALEVRLKEDSRPMTKNNAAT